MALVEYAIYDCALNEFYSCVYTFLSNDSFQNCKYLILRVIKLF